MILQVNNHSRYRNFQRPQGAPGWASACPESGLAAASMPSTDSELRMVFLRTRAVFNHSFTPRSLNSTHAHLVGIGGTLSQPDPHFDGGGSQNSSTKIYYRGSVPLPWAEDKNDRQRKHIVPQGGSGRSHGTAKPRRMSNQKRVSSELADKNFTQLPATSDCLLI